MMPTVTRREGDAQRRYRIDREQREQHARERAADREYERWEAWGPVIEGVAWVLVGTLCAGLLWLFLAMGAA